MSSTTSNRQNYWATRLGFEPASTKPTTSGQQQQQDQKQSIMSAMKNNSTPSSSPPPRGGGGSGGGYYINQSLPLDAYYERKLLNDGNAPPLQHQQQHRDSVVKIAPLDASESTTSAGGGNGPTHARVSMSTANPGGENGVRGSGSGMGGLPLPMIRTGTLGPNMKQSTPVTSHGPSFPPILPTSQLTATNLSTYFSIKLNNTVRSNSNTGGGGEFRNAPSSPVSTCSCVSNPDREAMMSAILGVSTEDPSAGGGGGSAADITSPRDDDALDMDKILEDDFGHYDDRSRRGSLSAPSSQNVGTPRRGSKTRHHRTYHRSNCLWNKNNLKNRSSDNTTIAGGGGNSSASTSVRGGTSTSRDVVELEELRRRANLVLKRRQLKESLVKKRNQKMVARDVNHIDQQMCNRLEEEEKEKLRVLEERRAKRLAHKKEVRDQRERKAEETEIEAFFLKKYVLALQHETEEAARHLERGGGGAAAVDIIDDGSYIATNIMTGFSFAIGADEVDEATKANNVLPEDKKTMCKGPLSPKQYERIIGATSLLLALSTQDVPKATNGALSSFATNKQHSGGGNLDIASDEDDENDDDDDDDDEDSNQSSNYEDDVKFDLESYTEKSRGAAALVVHRYINYFRIDILHKHREEYKSVRKELTEAQDALQQQENRLGEINSKLRRNVAEYEARLKREDDAQKALEKEAHKAQKAFEKTLKAERQKFWNEVVLENFKELAESECEALGGLIEEARDSHQASLSRCRARVFNENLSEAQRNELECGVQDAITKTRNKWVTARFPLIRHSAEKCVELAHLMLEEAYQAEVAEEHQIRHLHWEMQQVQAVNPATPMELNMTPPSSPRAAQVFTTEAGAGAAYAAATDMLTQLSTDREIFNTLLMLGIVDKKLHSPNVDTLFGCLGQLPTNTTTTRVTSTVVGEDEEGQHIVDPVEAARIAAAKRRQRQLQSHLSRVTLSTMLSQLAEIAVDILLSDEEADELDTLLESAGERQRLQVLDDYAAMDVLRKRLKKRT